MSIRLFRVDERLIHGQVVIGWGRHLHPGRFVVVDDALATSEWEQELYHLAVDEETEVRFLDVGSAREGLDVLRDDDVPTILLTRDIETMRRLAEGRALSGEAVNIGGLHPAPGRRAVRGWLNLGPEDEMHLRALDESGVTVEGRDLPDAPRVGLEAMLTS
ncbi:MAG TPA: PTS sugar transporter subunit IIB [Longimicrobiales bacterium]|nr:PTS sugar transporter subunit IIB [Longimicrobiales bacterium]